MALNLGNVFVIPDDLVAEVPCQIAPRLFTDPAFDVDLDDPDFLDLSHEEQQERLNQKTTAEQTAKAACNMCPIMQRCREWALETYVNGVCGALTEDERASMNGGSVPEYTAITQRGPRGKVNGDLIARWTAQGMSTSQIAGYLKASPRTVERYRAALAHDVSFTLPVAAIDIPAPEGVAKETAARNRINFDRVTEETLAMYKALADGAVRSREEILTVAAPYVDDRTALNTGKHLSGTRVKKVEAGRRKFLLNRIDIAARRGRVHVAKPNGTVVLWLDEVVRAELEEWLASQS